MVDSGNGQPGFNRQVNCVPIPFNHFVINPQVKPEVVSFVHPHFLSFRKACRHFQEQKYQITFFPCGLCLYACSMLDSKRFPHCLHFLGYRSNAIVTQSPHFPRSKQADCKGKENRKEYHNVIKCNVIIFFHFRPVLPY